jgi:preprotein translocase subunit SecF
VIIFHEELFIMRKGFSHGMDLTGWKTVRLHVHPVVQQQQLRNAGTLQTLELTS